MARHRSLGAGPFMGAVLALRGAAVHRLVCKGDVGPGGGVATVIFTT